MQRENEGRFWDDRLYPCDEDFSSLLGSAWEAPGKRDECIVCVCIRKKEKERRKRERKGI